MGLHVQQSGKSHIGFATTRLSDVGREQYWDLIEQVVEALRLSATPEVSRMPAPENSAPVGEAVVSIDELTEKLTSKYVFAHCQCVGNRGQKRTLRMARGHWHPVTVLCAICKSPFVESPAKRAEKTPNPAYTPRSV